MHPKQDILHPWQAVYMVSTCAGCPANRPASGYNIKTPYCGNFVYFNSHSEIMNLQNSLLLSRALCNCSGCLKGTWIQGHFLSVTVLSPLRNLPSVSWAAYFASTLACMYTLQVGCYTVHLVYQDGTGANHNLELHHFIPRFFPGTLQGAWK